MPPRAAFSAPPGRSAVAQWSGEVEPDGGGGAVGGGARGLIVARRRLGCNGGVDSGEEAAWVAKKRLEEAGPTEDWRSISAGVIHL
jgi:hypothetical protein